MSLDAMRWAWQRELPATRKLVLLSLADRADEHHRCFPSIARLEKDTGLDRKTIMTAIADMEKIGLLDAKKQHGSVSIYTLIGVSDRHQTSTRNGTSTSAELGTSAENGTSTNNGTQTSTKNGTRTSTKNGTQNLSINQSMNPKGKEAKSSPLSDDFKLPVEWLEKAKAKGMTFETATHEFERFKNHHIAKGTRSKDWARQWASWYLAWVTYGAKQVGSGKNGKGATEDYFAGAI